MAKTTKAPQRCGAFSFSAVGTSCLYGRCRFRPARQARIIELALERDDDPAPKKIGELLLGAVDSMVDLCATVRGS